MNTQNLVILSGKVAQLPTYATHADGSRSVFLKLAVRDNFKSKNVKLADGTIGEGFASHFITCQGFLPAVPKNPQYANGVYGMVEVGMPVAISGHMGSYVVKDGAIDKNTGKPVNRWEQCIRIDTVQLLETKEAGAVRRANQARKAANAAAAAATTPAAAQPGYAGGITGENEFGIPADLNA